MEGWLRKRTSLFTWRKYFVSLSAKGVLHFYTRLESKRTVGTVRLSRRTRVSLDPKKDCALVLHGDGRSIRLAAESRRDAVLWKEMLTGAVAAAASHEDLDPSQQPPMAGTAGDTRAVPEATTAPPAKEKVAPQHKQANVSSTSPLRESSCSADEFAEDFFYDPSTYALSKAIGRGSYGVVVSGRDLRTQLPCAIKKIGNAFADLVDAKRIVREIRLMHCLSHPNLLRIYDCYAKGHDFDEIYIVTELLQTDLHDVIYARRPLSRAHVQFFCYQLLRGLEHMHAAGVLHRDVKPGNILLNDKCELKICDFGLARAVRRVSTHQHHTIPIEQQLPLTEYVVTRWYRAPELLLSCPGYDGAVDIWSLGCVLAEMVERRPLFGGRDVIDQIRRVAAAVKAVRPRDIDRAALEAFVTNHKARAYVLSVPQNDHVRSWADVVTKLADTKPGLDLLDSLLRFNPASRPSATSALQHPFLASMLQELARGDVKVGRLDPDPVDLCDIERCPLEKAALQRILKFNDLRYTPPDLAHHTDTIMQ